MKRLVLPLLTLPLLGCTNAKFADDCREFLGYDEDQVVDIEVACEGLEGSASFRLEITDWDEKPCGGLEIDCQHARRDTGYISGRWVRIDGDPHIEAEDIQEIACGGEVRKQYVSVELEPTDNTPGLFRCWASGSGVMECGHSCYGPAICEDYSLTCSEQEACEAMEREPVCDDVVVNFR